SYQRAWYGSRCCFVGAPGVVSKSIADCRLRAKIVGRRSSPPFPFLGGKDDRSTTLFCSETPRRFTHRPAHAACSCEIRPQTGQLSLPSRSVATSSGGQQRGHKLNPNSPPSVAWAIRRSF